MSTPVPWRNFYFLQFNQGLSTNTLAAYRTDLNKFIAWLEQQKLAWQNLQSEHLEDFILDLSSERKAASNARLLSSVKQLYLWAQQQKLLDSNPVHKSLHQKQSRKSESVK
ncbi:hypothetical protein THIOSC13_770006 [uncultured Thiomicrorhabdus sp.]